MGRAEGLGQGISAYVPSYNNEATIKASVGSLLDQSIRPDEVFVVDDGSLDNTRELALSTGVEVLSNGKNRGRGFTRAKAINYAKHGIVLCCDATNILDSDFIEKTIPFFADPQVVSISGHLRSSDAKGVVGRWRSRHLFKEDVVPGPPVPTSMLITYGTLMRKAPILEVGNFDASLIHTEDNELGIRLHAAGYKILGSPDAVVRSIAPARLWKTLERYWRWYAGLDEKVTLGSYLHMVKASIRPMAQKDLAEGDWPAALVSLLCPHYCMWKSASRKLLGQTNRN